MLGASSPGREVKKKCCFPEGGDIARANAGVGQR